MRKWLIKIISLPIVLTVLLSATLVQAQPSQPTTSTTAIQHRSLQSSVQGWIAEIAKQPSFEQWKNAKFDISPLGPGTHGWLALVKRNGNVVGYLVVHALEQGGFTLGEYGVGSYLYNDTTLRQSIKQLELIPSKVKSHILYIHPLLSVWSVNDDKIYIDAMSGESLPLDSEVWSEAVKQEQKLATLGSLSRPSGTKLLKSVNNPSFDPYHTWPWLTNKPVEVSSSNKKVIQSILDAKKQLQYTAERYNKKMRYVWSVTGYHSWADGTYFAALETDEFGDNRRYIPLQLLTELGQFYR